MHKIWRLFLTLCLIATPTGVPMVLAQGEQESVELTRAVVETNRRVIIAEAMQLTDTESQEFWPVYKKYRTEADMITERVIKMMNDYAANIGIMTDQVAQDLLDEFLDIEKARLKLKTKYVRQFNKVLPSIKVTRYFQIENKLDTIIEYDLARSVPLVE